MNPDDWLPQIQAEVKRWQAEWEEGVFFLSDQEADYLAERVMDEARRIAKTRGWNATDD